MKFRLYQLGWNSALHSHVHPIKHMLMSIFYLYRLGFREARAWAREQALESRAESFSDPFLNK